MFVRRPAKKTGQKSIRRLTSDAYAPYMFMMPTMLLFIAIFLFPILFVLASSFTSWNLLKPTAGVDFIGLGNYLTLLKDPNFWAAMKNTAVFTVISVPLSMALGILLALGVEKLTRGKSLVEMLLLIPLMVAPVSIYLGFRFMFEPTYGIINKILDIVGIDGPGWLSSTGTAMISVIIAELWRVVPFVYLVTFAALKTLPVDPIESARVDGANERQIFFHITVPMIKPTLLVLTIIRIMDAVRVFENIYVLTKGGPGTSTKTIQYLCYEMSFGSFNIGKGSAMAVIIVLVIIVVGMALIRAMNKAKKQAL